MHVMWTVNWTHTHTHTGAAIYSVWFFIVRGHFHPVSVSILRCSFIPSMVVAVSVPVLLAVTAYPNPIPNRIHKMMIIMMIQNGFIRECTQHSTAEHICDSPTTQQPNISSPVVGRRPFISQSHCEHNNNNNAWHGVLQSKHFNIIYVYMLCRHLSRHWAGARMHEYKHQFTHSFYSIPFGEEHRRDGRTTLTHVPPPGTGTHIIIHSCAFISCISFLLGYLLFSSFLVLLPTDSFFLHFLLNDSCHTVRIHDNHALASHTPMRRADTYVCIVVVDAGHKGCIHSIYLSVDIVVAYGPHARCLASLRSNVPHRVRI